MNHVQNRAVIGAIVFLQSVLTSAYAADLTKIGTLAEKFKCEAADFQSLRAVLVDGNDAELIDKTEKTYGAAEKLNRRIVAKCSKDIRLTCCGKKIEHEVEILKGFAVHYDITGPIESLGITSGELNGAPSGGGHYYKTVIDTKKAAKGIDCFIKALK